MQRDGSGTPKPHLYLGKLWWGGWGLNPRPEDYEALRGQCRDQADQKVHRWLLQNSLGLPVSDVGPLGVWWKGTSA